MSITRPAIFFAGAELMIVAVGVATGKFDNGAQAETATLKIVIIRKNARFIKANHLISYKTN